VRPLPLVLLIGCARSPSPLPRTADALREIDDIAARPDTEIDLAAAALTLERVVRPDLDLPDALRRLDQLAAATKPDRVAINTLLFDRESFGVEESQRWLGPLLQVKRGQCLSLSILWLAVAHRAGLAASLVSVPEHVFVVSGGINVETTQRGLALDDDVVRRRFRVPDSFYYLRPLTRRESVALLVISLGNALYAKGLAFDALACHERAAAIFPGCPEAWTNRGVCLRAMGRRAEAIESYDRAIELEPSLVSAWNNRANAKAELGDLDHALADYDIAVRLDPSYVDSLVNRAGLLLRMSRLVQAIESLDAALAIDPAHARAWHHRASAFRLRGDENEARRCADRARELGIPDD
jgi:tetratricopeptide (TPR) repeat protein